MKRSEALAALSRDHHHGLFVAHRLRRAGVDDAPEARRAFLAYWDAEGRVHFHREEDVLLPAYARHRDPSDPDVVRVLVDHVDLRRRGEDLAADDDPPLDSLHELGARLAEHIRHEERVLFPAIEAALDDEELAAVAARLDRA